MEMPNILLHVRLMTVVLFQLSVQIILIYFLNILKSIQSTAAEELTHTAKKDPIPPVLASP